MTRRNFLATITTFVTGLLTSCRTSLFFKPTPVDGTIVVINNYVVLEEDKHGITYDVRDGGVLDLNGHILFGNTDKGRCRHAVLLSCNAIVKNGTIDGYYNAIVVRNGLEEGYLDRLINVSRLVAQRIGDNLRNRSATRQIVRNVDIRDIYRHGIYCTSHITEFEISQCSMEDVGYMHIYVDHGVTNSVIKNNTFGRCGYNHYRGREAIALDGCANIQVIDNVFEGPMKGGAINAYTNWGENRITREITQHHDITYNKFHNLQRGVSLASRHNRDIAGYKGADYAQFITLAHNEFVNVNLPIEDFGTDNKIEFNKIYEDS